MTDFILGILDILIKLDNFQLKIKGKEGAKWTSSFKRTTK